MKKLFKASCVFLSSLTLLYRVLFVIWTIGMLVSITAFVLISFGLSMSTPVYIPPILIVSVVSMALVVLILNIHSRIETAYMTVYRYKNYSNAETTMFMILVLDNGEIKKVKNGKAVWGTGDEYTVSMPLNWKDKKGATNDLLVLVPVKHDAIEYYIPFIFELNMEDEFSAEKIFALMPGVEPFSGLGSIRTGMYTVKHLNLERYLKSQLDFSGISFKLNRSRILSGFIARGLLYDESMLEAIGSTLPLHNKLFNVSSYKINYKKSSNLRIVPLGLEDKKDIEQLQAA